MKRIILFGNSASGKTTLASHLSREMAIGHLDLDTIAWKTTKPPKRLPLDCSWAPIKTFMQQHSEWMIEGCYTDLLTLVSSFATDAIFLDLPMDKCIENARLRPFERHKFESPEAQEENINLLIKWISEYHTRSDTFSWSSHQHLLNNFKGKKYRITRYQQLDKLIEEYLR